MAAVGGPAAGAASVGGASAAAASTAKAPATKAPAKRSPANGTGPAPSAPSAAPARRPVSAGRAVDQGAGVVLAFFAWAWVGLPFFQGGPKRVRDVIRAKFTNKAADGTWLP